MTQSSPDDNELDAALRRMEHEFGRRPPPEGAEEPATPRPPPGPSVRPLSGDVIPQPSSPPPRPPPPARRSPRVSFIILWAIGGMYVLSCVLSRNLMQPSLNVLIFLGAKENALIDQGEYWRLLTATFLHGNLIHIFFNGYALFALGPESERIYGTGRFVALYGLAGLGGSVASYLMSTAPSVGASGAIFGLIGGLGIFYYLNRQALGEFGRAQVQNMGAIVFINLLIGFASPGVIDNWGHIGGLVIGVAAGVALAPRLNLDTRFAPPVFERQFPTWGWAGALGLLIILVALAVLLPGA